MMEFWRNGLVYCRIRRSVFSSLFIRRSDPPQTQSPPILHHSRTPLLHSSSGFSILEVLVALAVFAIVAGSLLAVLGNHMRDVSYLQDQARAVRIARREMDSLQRMSVFQTVEETGEAGRFSWTSLVTDDLPLEVPGEEFSDTGASDAEILAFLEVQVSWSEIEGGAASKRVRLQALYDFPEDE